MMAAPPGWSRNARHHGGILFANSFGVSAENKLCQQLLEDLHRLHELILRYAKGDRSAKARRDRLEGAVQIKFAIWRAIRRLPPDDTEDRTSPGR